MAQARWIASIRVTRQDVGWFRTVSIAPDLTKMKRTEEVAPVPE